MEKLLAQKVTICQYGGMAASVLTWLFLLFQLSIMDKKLDQLVHVLNAVAQKQQIPIRAVEDEV
jgi:hypothetical protein